MRVEFAEQYGIPGLVPTSDELCAVSGEEFIEHAVETEACFVPLGEDVMHFVVQFPGRSMELYTEEALIRSVEQWHTSRG